MIGGRNFCPNDTPKAVTQNEKSLGKDAIDEYDDIFSGNNLPDPGFEFHVLFFIALIVCSTVSKEFDFQHIIFNLFGRNARST